MYAYDNRGFRYRVSQMHVNDNNSNYGVEQTSDDSVDQTSGDSGDQTSGYNADQNSDDSVDQNSHDSVDQTSDDSVFFEINDAHLTRSNSDSDSESGNDQKKKPDGDGEGDALLGEGIKFRNKPKKENQCLGKLNSYICNAYIYKKNQNLCFLLLTLFYTINFKFCS